MNLAELVGLLNDRRIKLSVKNGELVIHGKKQALTEDDLLERLREHKAALLELIESGNYVGPRSAAVDVPRNSIPADCTRIEPVMLPLVQLTPEEIARVVGAVAGGAANVQDIYPLAPLQEGILFHHLVAREGDPYLVYALRGFDSRARLQSYLQALRAVIERHDILRTAVLWEGLPEPVQVVWRKAPLVVQEVSVDATGGDIAEQLRARFDPRHYRLDVREAPLLRVFVAEDRANARWVMMQLFHHLAGDHTTAEAMQQEIQAHLLGQAERLPKPLPFRNFVAQARLGVPREEHEAFFRKLLGDVEEPTAPFGLTDVQGDGSGVVEARRAVDAQLARRLRERARALGVSAASVCHLAWAQVLARTSGRDDVVFGTLLFGRMQGGEGADRVLGLFINTLPMRIRIGDETVQDGVRATHAQLAQLLRHEHASLALAQRCSAVAAPAPLFSALLNYRHSTGMAQISPEARQAWEGIELLGGEERTNYPFVLSVDDLGEAFVFTAKVQSPLDPSRICAYMHTALEQLVRALERAPATPLRSLDVMPPSERQQLLVEWNDTASDYPADALLHNLFEAQAARTPDAIAVEYEGLRLTYEELDARANQLAHYLGRHGVGPDAMVGICLERSLEMVVGILGILKAGGSYVPIDPDYPPQRIGYMLEEIQSPLVLTQRRLHGKLLLDRARTIDLDTDWHAIAQESSSPVSGDVTASNIAYVIYTSGSTGHPKGVMIPHAGICNLMFWTQRVYPMGNADVVLQKTPFGFDASIWEFFAPLQAGAKLVMAQPGGHLDPAYLTKAILAHRVSILKVVPSQLRMLLEDETFWRCAPPLRRIYCAGEPLTRDLCDAVNMRLPGVTLHNLYGPTETSIDATYWDCPSGGCDVVPIGRPVDNTRTYVVDARMQLCPIGLPGELLVGGAGLARGYLNNAELTAEKFISDQFSTTPGARLYRTGDQVRYLVDGNIEFLGRIDHQVKLRGYRIELGEIEAGIARHPAVREVVILAREDAPGDKRLAAYVVAEDAPANLVDELRTLLRASLPEYMVPAAFVTLEKLPLTPNGKVDRKGLPAPDGGGYASRGYEAPVGEVEDKLAQIWAEVLKLERVGRHDNFFDLGGHSLLAMQVISRVRQALSVELPLRELFAAPTVAGLSLCIGALRARQGAAQIVDELGWFGRTEPAAGAIGARQEFEL